MKNGMIFARKTTWRSRLEIDYLDETSELKISRRQGEGIDVERTGLGRRLKQFNDYASKETLGQVHAGGFLHHAILDNGDGTRTAPSQLSNAERKRRIAEAWFRHFRKFPSSSDDPVIQHRMVFSMSCELHDKLVSAGISPDRVLQTTTKKMMAKFAERFHSADSIGYAYGLHHDTDNLHVHIALCPRSERGAYVGCSESRTTSSGNKNQMKYLRSWFEQENRRWEQMLAEPQKLQRHLAQRFDADKITFAPRLNHLEAEALRSTQTAEAIRLQQLYHSIRNLESAIAVKRKIRLAERNANALARLLGKRKSRLARTVERVAAAVDRRSIREMQNLLFRIKRDYRAAHARYSRLYGFTSYANRIPIASAQRHQQNPR